MRPTIDDTYMHMLQPLERRTTCVRRGVACILTNAAGQVLSTGYNGVASGCAHCNEGHPCEGAASSKGGDLDKCQAIHAEQNALLQCPDVQKIHKAYVSCSPCIHCIKLLMNTSCKIIVAREVYDAKALALWLANPEHEFILSMS